MKQVIEGLSEGLQAIAEAVGGGGGGSSIVPTPAAADEGKVLTANDDGTASWEDGPEGLPDDSQAANQSVLMKTVTGPQWETINQVPAGGTQGQVLTKGASGYDWANASGGLPDHSQATQGSVLALGYSGDPEWDNITDIIPEGSKGLVPTTTGVTNGYVLTNNNGTPAWAAASGGGGLPSYDDSDVGNVLQVQYDDLDDRTYLEWVRPTSPVREVRYFSMLSKSDFVVDGQYVYKLFLEGNEPTASYDYTMIGFGTTGVPFTFCSMAHSVGEYYNENNGDLRIYFNKADFDMIDANADITIRRIRYQ